tara:strand:- start:443 stop:784 length:342 start_codon:yes stop_codon:yes gene_type:complete
MTGLKIFLFFFLFLFVLLFGVDVIFYQFTKFEKIITVKSKYLRNRQDRDQYMFIDTENNIYHIKNRLLSLEFDEAEDWNLLKDGKKYLINGYKFRVPFLGMYPTVIRIKSVDK